MSRLQDRIPLILHSGIVNKFECVTAMLAFMEKLNFLLGSKYVNTWEFLRSLGKKLEAMMILTLKIIFYSGITWPDFGDISSLF